MLIDFLKSVKDTRSQDLIQLMINDQLSKKGDYVTSLASTLEISNRFEQQEDKEGILAAYRQLSSGYYYAGDKEKDVLFGKKALVIAKELNNPSILSSITNNISTSYSQKHIPDSALLYARQSIAYANKTGDAYALSGVLGTMAEAFISDKQYDSALIYCRYALKYAANNKVYGDLGLVWTLNDFSQIFLETNHYDSSKYYAWRAIDISKMMGYKDQLLRAYEYLVQAFDRTSKPDSAYKYLQLAVIIKDSLFSTDKTKQVQGIVAREQSRLQELENEKLNFKNQIRVYGLLAGLLILSIIAFLLYRNNRQKQKANTSLQEQKNILENTLMELKSTQQQLIQSEKMASLGELTAGIAHEIQNPLNFVNNFSEVNTELIAELGEEVDKGNISEVKTIAKDIKGNEEKINFHGKRADAIVKGMLQHSRSSSGIKEPTDINALSDEYLRLSYHGLRAKDKSFNATLKTDFDPSIGKINIIPQDFGRVMLNLLNNAFYAVAEKKKQKSLLTSEGETSSSTNEVYEPIVTVTTRRLSPASGGWGAEITVTDNGNGIPSSVKEKIFQPFFTTKPTGQGTGLGLSLSYDIITKGHGGELKVETNEGQSTIFSILLPPDKQ
ncbi:MAG: ATP-binding protein [Ferruginibacter sp.]